MFVFRHIAAESGDHEKALYEHMEELCLHDEDAQFNDAPQKVNSLTMFQYVFSNALEYQPEGVFCIEDLLPHLQTDPNWNLIDIDPAKLATGDVLFVQKKDATKTHLLAIANLSWGVPMIKVTAEHLDGASLMVLSAFLKDHDEILNFPDDKMQTSQGFS